MKTDTENKKPMAKLKPFLNDAEPIVKAENGRKLIVDINVATAHEKRVTAPVCVNDQFNKIFGV